VACLAVACLAVALRAPAAPAASPAWAPLAASGPTNLPPVQSEISRLSVDAGEGDFTLTARTFAASGVIASLAAHTTVIVPTPKAGFAAGQTVIGEYFQPGTTILGPLGSSAFIISKPTTNTTTKTGVAITATSAEDTTAPLPFDALPSALEEALNGLTTIGGEGATVSLSGGPGDRGASAPYFIAFGGAAADANLPAPGQPLLEADGAGLSGGLNTGARLSTVLDGGPGVGEIAVYAQNIGGAPSAGAVSVTLTLPDGVKTTATPPKGEGWTCGEGAGRSEVACASEEVAQPGYTLRPFHVDVSAEAGTAESGVAHVEVESPGAMPGAYDMPLLVTAIPAPPGLQAWSAATYDEAGLIDTRAGAHPFSASTGMLVNTVRGASGRVVPAGEFRDILVDTPPGFVGNPTAPAQCPEADKQIECDPASIVATADIPTGAFGKPGSKSTVVNLQAPYGYPAKFRFPAGGVSGSKTIVVNVVAALRSDEDYGLRVGTYDAPQILPVFGAFFTIWGTPAAPGHDGQRCQTQEAPSIPGLENCATAEELREAGGTEAPFLSNPVDCAEEALRPPEALLNVNLWQDPTLLFTNHVPLQPVKGCEALDFEGDLALRSSESAADSPASFTTSLTTPTTGLLDPARRIDPPIEKAVVQLPEGVSLNPAGADGLAACSEAQIGYKGGGFGLPNPMRFDMAPQGCPDASKIGSGELHTPLVNEPLRGDLYLAAQGEGNPFGSTFAVYLVIEDPRHGIFIKLPGEVQADPADGQISVTFEHLPPYPFERLDLTLKGGDRSALASPQTCGEYTTKTTFTPWSAPGSGPPTVSESRLTIDSGPGGAPCAGTASALPFGLGFDAGTTDPLAGAHSTFLMRLTRPDGAQSLDRFQLRAPKGFSATLRGVPYCPEAALAHAASNEGGAEQASPSCPAASQVGVTEVGAGAGGPFYVPGKVYLAGPYEGAKLSLAAIVPALAGPFDLGTQVVRAALRIDPASGQVTAVTDPLPRILDGVPLRIRDVRVKIDKPGFALNPTDCSPKQITSRASGSAGAGAVLASRFQVGGCGRLGFRLRLFIRLFGGVHRGDFPRFRAVYAPRPGDANLKDLVLRFPRSEFIEQGHFRTICTRVQYAAGGGLGEQCPRGSIYGYVRAVTPLLEQPLSGPVYLRSSSHDLPDVVLALHGQVDAEASVRIDSVKGGLRASVEGAPDVPLTKVIVNMRGRQKGLFVNSRDICKPHAYRATVTATAHNDRRARRRPALRDSRCPKAAAHRKRHRGHRRRHRGVSHGQRGRAPGR